MPRRTSNDDAFAGPLIAVVLGVIVLFAFVGAAVLIASLRSSSDEATRDVYVSIGDSLAAGSGASDPASTSFPALLAAREEVSLHNVAAAGATTQDVMDDQLARALVSIQAGRVAFVTISAGGNDLAALIPNAACVEDPLPASCPLDDALARVETNLDAIVAYIRDADRRVPIVLLAYPNLFSGTGHAWEAPAGRVLPQLGDVIRDVAARYDRVAVAEPAPQFEGNGGRLTHVLDQPFDPHPNDAGHSAIADAFAAALEDAR
ncbi:MAG: SGNH/GDSL hydrolase family protein [Dehalococcoidia bacterium]